MDAPFSRRAPPKAIAGYPAKRHTHYPIRDRRSRIQTRLSIGEASAGDTAEYIRYRIKRAGADRELFSSDAIAIIHEETHGRLRDIDRVATDALQLGGRRKSRIVDRDLVVRVFGDQEASPED